MAMGRPEKPINWDLLDLYLKAGCSRKKIAEAFHITTETLSYRVEEKYGVNFSTYSSNLCSEGDILIEAQQYQKAMKGYWPALLWLGKVRCGQREPELISLMAANQTSIAQSHENMRLRAELDALKAKYDDKPEAE